MVKTETGSARRQTMQFTTRWGVLAAVIVVVLAVHGLAAGTSAFSSARLPATILLAAGGGLVASLLIGIGSPAPALSAAPTHAEQNLQLLEEAQRLRTTRERARAIYEMATTLSGTLDHRRVLEAAQSIGTLSLRDDIGPDAHLISAVLLFQGDDNKLSVVTSRGLTATDQTVRISGQRGVLGLALKQAQPVFGGFALHDPELRYFAAFQDAKSVLAIPLGAGFDLYGAILFGCDRPNAFSDDHIELMTAIGTQSTLSLQNAVLYQNLLTEKEKIVEVEEDARKKLARDLHDGPTQSVAAIAMRANFIRRLIERQPQQAIDELWKVEDLARRTTKEIRHMLFTLRPLVLENQGLVAALRQLAEKMQDTYNRTVLVQTSSAVEMYLDTNAQGVLFYIIEEAVNNAHKHAQPQQVRVRLYQKDALVVAEIEDDGIGFDVQAIEQDYDQRGSFGLVNMRERAGMVEGQLHIQSAKGKGTKITVLVPVDTAGVAGTAVDLLPPLQLQSQREARMQAASDRSRPVTRPHHPTDRLPETRLPHPLDSDALPPDLSRLPRVPPPRPRTPTRVPWPSSPPVAQQHTPAFDAESALDQNLFTGPFSAAGDIPPNGIVPPAEPPSAGPFTVTDEQAPAEISAVPEADSAPADSVPAQPPQLDPAPADSDGAPAPAPEAKQPKKQSKKSSVAVLPKALRKRLETGDLPVVSDAESTAATPPDKKPDEAPPSSETPEQTSE